MRIAVVLVGPHCAGKSTLARELHRRHAWALHLELGDGLRTPSRFNPQEPNRPQPAFEDKVLRAEVERDADPESRRHRVIETWHPGNLAWAESREEPAALAELHARTKAAVSAYLDTGALVLVQPLQCPTAAVLDRRAAGAASRIPWEDSEEKAMLGLSQRVGLRAAAIAQDLGLTLLPVLDTGELSLPEAADKIYSAVLERAMPQCMDTSFPSPPPRMQEAVEAVRIMLSLDGRWRKVPALEGDVRALKELLAAPPAPVPALPLAGGRAVVVEGLDGCGKSTLVASLARALGARAASSPMPWMARLQALAGNTEQPQRLRRALYALGNYAAAQELVGSAGPVVMDRYHSSTLAYPLGASCATVEAVCALPQRLFAWPADLPAPALVLVLGAPEDVRMARLRARGHGLGAGEQAQAADCTLGGRIAAALGRVEGPRMVHLDASQPPDAVLAAALAACEAAGIARAAGVGGWAPQRSLPQLLQCADPLGELVRREHARSMCDAKGWRLSSSSWSMALATGGGLGDAPPLLRQVALFRVNEEGLLFVAQRTPGGSRGEAEEGAAGMPASATLLAGAAPLQEQWRLEGRAVPTGHVPDGVDLELLAWMVACAAPGAAAGDEGALATAAQAALAMLRKSWLEDRQAMLAAAGVAAYLLQPVWAECQVGGAGSVLGPLCVHWQRAHGEAAWEAAKAALPFGSGEPGRRQQPSHSQGGGAPLPLLRLPHTHSSGGGSL